MTQQERNCRGKSYRIKTGFRELDDYVLLGGAERGVVLGISSDAEGGVDEGEDVGLLVS
jgi:hypothetical protein